MSKIAIPILLVIALGLIGAQVYTIDHLHLVEQQLAADQAKTRGTADAVDLEIAKLKEANTASNLEQQKAIATVQQQIDQSSRQTRTLATQSREEAHKTIEELSARLSTSESKLQEHQQQSDARIDGEISGLKQATTKTQSNVASVSSDVSTVKNDLATTRTQLERTIADLRRTIGDMNVLSGLIATNAREVAALKQLGDRNYVEFMLFKRKDPVRLGDISVLLKQVDTKRNLYTVEFTVEDRKIEKTDRGINEPVQFFVGREKQPHEFVVNQINKDQIIGYLAMPKLAESRP